MSNEIYNNYQEYLAHIIREKIMARRVKFLGVIEIYIKGDLVILTGYEFGNKSKETFTYISNLNQPFSEYCLRTAMQLDLYDRLYFPHEEILLNMQNDITIRTINKANEIKAVFDRLNYSFEEFFDYINTNLQDYLIEYPEDGNL